VTGFREEGEPGRRQVGLQEQARLDAIVVLVAAVIRAGVATLRIASVSV
jgi:hypothetical protein